MRECFKNCNTKRESERERERKRMGSGTGHVRSTRNWHCTLKAKNKQKKSIKNSEKEEGTFQSGNCNKNCPMVSLISFLSCLPLLSMLHSLSIFCVYAHSLTYTGCTGKQCLRGEREREKWNKVQGSFCHSFQAQHLIVFVKSIVKLCLGLICYPSARIVRSTLH